MKVKKVTDIPAFFEAVDGCKGRVELLTGEGDRLNLKSKLCQFLSVGQIFAKSEELHLEIIASEEEDLQKLCKFVEKRRSQKGAPPFFWQKRPADTARKGTAAPAGFDERICVCSWAKSGQRTQADFFQIAPRAGLDDLGQGKVGRIAVVLDDRVAVKADLFEDLGVARPVDFAVADLGKDVFARGRGVGDAVPPAGLLDRGHEVL